MSKKTKKKSNTKIIKIPVDRIKHIEKAYNLCTKSAERTGYCYHKFMAKAYAHSLRIIKGEQ